MRHSRLEDRGATCTCSHPPIISTVQRGRGCRVEPNHDNKMLLHYNIPLLTTSHRTQQSRTSLTIVPRTRLSPFCSSVGGTPPVSAPSSSSPPSLPPSPPPRNLPRVKTAPSSSTNLRAVELRTESMHGHCCSIHNMSASFRFLSFHFVCFRGISSEVLSRDRMCLKWFIVPLH